MPFPPCCQSICLDCVLKTSGGNGEQEKGGGSTCFSFLSSYTHPRALSPSRGRVTYTNKEMYSPSASPASSAASEAPPYASTSTTGRRKRTAADVDYAALDAPDAEEDNVLEAGGNAQQRPTKRRAPRSTAAEKQARKVARMERNRSAYHVSCAGFSITLTDTGYDNSCSAGLARQEEATARVARGSNCRTRSRHYRIACSTAASAAAGRHRRRPAAQGGERSAQDATRAREAALAVAPDPARGARVQILPPRAIAQR